MAPIWQWDETVQRGWDYGDLAEVQRYDERMAAFRDVRAEAQSILGRLALSPDDVILEIGTGTGVFAREAALQCREVIAIDVSPPMLEYAARRAKDERTGNIVFRQSGFLTYEHQGEPLAAIVSQTALHHLPDAWKLIVSARAEPPSSAASLDFQGDTSSGQATTTGIVWAQKRFEDAAR